MLNDLNEDLKKLLLAGIGAGAIAADKSKDVVDQLVKRGEITVEQGKVLNEELKHKISNTLGSNKTKVDMMNERLEGLSEEELKQVEEKIKELKEKEK